MGAFSDDLTPDVPTPRLFDSPEEVPASPYSADQTKQTAMLAAMAQQRHGQPQAGTLDDATDINKSIIETGGETDLRDGISRMAQATKVNAIRDLQKQVLQNFALPAYDGLEMSGLLKQELDAQGAANDPNALEKEGLQQLQDTGPNNYDAEPLQAGYENMAKIALFQRETNKIEQERQNQGTFRNILDFFSIPLTDVYDKVFNIPSEGSIFTPGNKLRAEVHKLWGMPLADFEKTLPSVIENIKRHSGIFMQNRTEALSTIKSFYGVNDNDVLTANIMAAVDASSYVPIGTVARVLRNPSAWAMASGSRELATSIDATAIVLDTHPGMPNPGGIGKTADPVVAVVNSVPSYVKTSDLITPFVPAGSDIVKQIEAMKIPPQVANVIRRLAPEQQAEAIKNHVEGMLTRFGDASDRIVDIRRAPQAEVYTPTEEELRMTGEGGIDYEPPAPKTPRSGEMYFETGVDPETNVMSTHFYLGQRAGLGGYKTAEAAAADMKDMGFKADQFQNIDGLWYNKITTNVTETGAITPVLKEEDMRGITHVSAFVRSPSNYMADMFNKTRVTATMNKSFMQQQVFNPLIKQINALSGRGRRTLQTVLAKGESEQKWYDLKEFIQVWKENNRGVLPTDAEIKAYYGSKEVSDAVYHIFNNAVYTDNARRGWATVSLANPATDFNSGRVTGRIIEPNWGLRIHDLDTGEGFAPGMNAKEFRAKYETGNYNLVELKQHIEQKGKDPVKYVLAAKSDQVFEPLERQQLDYIAGGSRENTSKYYVKQAVRKSFQDGATYWTNPITHIAARTEYSAKGWADRMEAARVAWNVLKGKPAGTFTKEELASLDTETLSHFNARENIYGKEDRAAFEKVIESSPVGSVSKWQQLVDKGLIQEDSPFEALYDQEQPRYMTKVNAADEKWFEPDQSPEEAYYVSKGRMYYGEKGERLKDPQGNLAGILDPYRTLSRSVRNALNTQAFGDYNRLVIDEWSRLAMQTGAIDKGLLGRNLDPYNVFFHGQFDTNFTKGNAEFVQKLTENRNAHLRFLNFQERAQGFREQLTRRFASWVDSKGSWGEAAAGKALDSMSNNPTSAIRGFVFDPVLGFFDPGQLLVQTQTALAAMAVHPVYGFNAALSTPQLLWMNKNRSANLLDYLANSTRWLHGFDPKEYKAMVGMFNTSGWREVGGEMQMLDNMGNKLGGNLVTRGYRAVQQSGRYFFNLSERINRAVAFQIAWKDIRATHPEISITDDAFRDLVNLKTDDLTINMTTASKAAWQSGIPSVPTQFMAYQSRLLESMLPKVFGGNPRFTAAQRNRLIASQFLLYGTAGYPAATELYNFATGQYQKATGNAPDPTWYRAVSKGFFDSFLHEASGGQLDTNFAERAGTGTSWSQVIDKLSDGSLGSFLEVMAGASGEVTGNVIDSFRIVAQYFKAEQSDDISSEEWQLMAGDVMKNVNSLKRANAAYWIWRTGFLRDDKTGLPVAQATELEGYAAALGIPLREATERWDLIHDIKQRQDFVNDMSNQVVKIRSEARAALQETPPDMEKYNRIMKVSTGFLSSFRKDVLLQSEIIRATSEKEHRGAKSEWEAVRQQYQTKLGLQPMGGR